MAVPPGTDDVETKKELVKRADNQNGKEKDDSGDEKSTKSDQKKVPKFHTYCEKLNINPHLLMLKITLFVMYGATASLLPYLTIHMQSIGLTVEEIAIVYLALPLITFVSPPITGFLVDKLGHYKPVIILTLVLNAVFHHSLLLIPPMETPGVTPPAYVMRHPQLGIVEVWWSPCPQRECPDDERAVSMVLDDCLDHCKLWYPQPAPPRKSLLTEIHKGIAVRPPTIIAEKPVPDLHVPGPGGPNDDLHFRPSKKKPKNGNSTSKATTQTSTSTTQTTATPINTTQAEDEPFQFRIILHDNLMEPQESGEEDLEPPDDFTDRFPQSLLEANGVNFTALLDEDLRCGGNVQATNLTYKTLNNLAADCMLQKCTFREGGPETCPPDFQESDDRIFWIYFALRFLGTIMLTGGVTLMDPIALSLIQEHGGQFGRERLSSSVGMAIFSPLTGLLIDYSSQKKGYTDYSSAFYAYDVLLITSALSILLMPNVSNPPSDTIFQDLMKLMRLPHVLAFIFFLYLLGNFWGFIESFLFLYLKELGAPSYLLGITVTVGTVSSLPFLWGADGITKRFGHVNVVVLAFFSHAVRLMGYSFIESAWWCFPFEAIESVSVHLMWVAAATYCAVLAPKSLLATLIGVLGMAHFSLGRGSGSFLGGILIGNVGSRRAFRIMGLIAVGGGICYAVLQKFWLDKVAEKHAAKMKSDDPEAAKLNGDPEAEAAAEDATRASLERLSLMIQFNQRGSLTSLDRGSRFDLRPADRRRSTYSVRGSTSRVDLRRSTLEMNMQQARGSTPALSGSRGTLASKPPPVTRKGQRIGSITALPAIGARRDSIREEAEEHAEENEKVAPLPSAPTLQQSDK